MLNKNTIVSINCLINTSRQWAVADNAFSFRFPIEPNKEYIISANNASESVFRAGVASTEELPTQDNPVSLTSVTRRTNTNSPITVTTDSSSKYIVIQLSVAQAETTLNTLTIQEIKTYPITLPSGMELCKIGNYQDYIYKNGDSWYKHKEIGKVVFDGTESWTKGSKSNETYSVFQANFARDFIQQTALIYCDKFIPRDNITPSILDNEGIFTGNIGTYNAPMRISILNSRLNSTDATGFKTWLSNNNVTAYAPLQEPVEELITDTTLINQLNQIAKSKTYQGVTHITQTNAELPFILTLDYKKSNLLRIKALENA